MSDEPRASEAHARTEYEMYEHGYADGSDGQPRSSENHAWYLLGYDDGMLGKPKQDPFDGLPDSVTDVLRTFTDSRRRG